MIYADQRWIGNHGIGRFARHVLDGMQYRPVALSAKPAAALDSWRLSRALADLNSKDLFFSPGYNSPLYCPAPFVFTVHDLSHVFCPENSSPLIKLYYATIIKRACNRAARILTVSEFTRNQIITWSGVSPGKVVNVSCGVDSGYCPEGQAYGLAFPYVLCVSNRKRHKNEFRLVEAFSAARIDPQVHLVFTGSSDPDLMELINRREMAQRIDFLGPVEEFRLPSLYRGAAALAFPSLYEGFGLPVLEAMACGTAVVTSNVTALPEVAGGAAILVDPTSVDQIAAGIENIIESESMRRQLKRAGLARAAQFSWQRTVESVRAILHRCEAETN